MDNASGRALREAALSPSATEPVPVSSHSGNDQPRGPRRAHTLLLDIGADTLDDLYFALRAISDDLRRDRLSVGASGSPSVGWSYAYHHDASMTHDRFFAELDVWLARDSDASLAEDPKGLSPEGVAARAEGIAKTSPESLPNPLDLETRG